MHQIKKILWCILAFCFPIFPKLLPAVIVLLAILNIIDYTTLKKQVAFQKYFLLYYIFYGLLIVGLLFTNNIPHGLFDLETKLSFLLFPFLACGVQINKKHIQRILTYFTLGNIIIIPSLIYNSYQNFLLEKQGVVIHPDYFLGKFNFYSSFFSRIIHPSYFSLYITLSILFVLYILFTSTARKIVWILALLILCTGFYLCDSLMGFIAAGITVPVFLFWKLKQTHKILFKISLALGGLLIFASIIYYFPKIKEKYKAISHMDINKESKDSIYGRVLAWKASIKLIKENPILGVGTGDVRDELLKKYQEMGYTGVAQKNYNPHNQYLQTYLSTGVLGFLTLLLLLLIPFVLSLIKGKILYSLFSLLFLLNLTAESMLENQAGIVFFCFFNTIFAVDLFHTNQNNYKH